jgi:hypothetical protein
MEQEDKERRVQREEERKEYWTKHEVKDEKMEEIKSIMGQNKIERVE